jgi:hypothetical protein
MNARVALQRLWWKELRQLAPIVIMLPLLGLLLLLLEFLTYQSPTQSQLTPSLVVILGMPGLFAAGAGALLVGHEKELRTLDWLSSLPIPSRKIVRVKLGAATTALLMLWVLSGLLVAATSAARPLLTTLDIPWASWILNSLFVLLAGFALAWTMRSALTALLVVVPVAVLPFLIAYIVDRIAPWREFTFETTLMVCQGFGIVIASWLTDRAGRRALAPQSPQSERAVVWTASLDRYRSAAQSAGYGELQSPLPALLWQVARQSRAVLLGTSLLIVAAVLSAAMYDPRYGVLTGISFLLAFLATTWLGVSVFQSDSVGNRIRFLADRGISPRLIWATRQAVPASVLAAFFLLSAFLLSFMAGQWNPSSLRSILTTTGFAALLVGWIYAVAQWSSQIFFSPIISAVASPFIVLAALGYGAFAIQSLGVPWWLPPLLLLIPPAATLTLTRRWMDRRFGFSYWASHAGFLAAALIIPWIPLLITVARTPTMPTAVAQELRQASENQLYARITSHELVFSKSETDSLASMELQWERQLDDVERQLSVTPGPISASSLRVLEQLRGIATLTRMSLDEATATAGKQRVYRRSVGLLMQIAQRMRLSPQIIDQDVADLIEIWLLIELRREQARENLGDAVYQAVARSLADQAGRSEARTRAVALSWLQFQAELGGRNPPKLGGYNLLSFQANVGTIRGGLLGKRQLAPAVTDLWELARDGERAATPERLARIALYWRRPLGEYGIGSAGGYLRADNLDQFVHPGFQYGQLPVASQWYADWERQAAEMFHR